VREGVGGGHYKERGAKLQNYKADEEGREEDKRSGRSHRHRRRGPRPVKIVAR
jgi:hypothetical protein